MNGMNAIGVIPLCEIQISQSFRQRILSCSHEYLRYLAQTRAEKNIRNTMTWPGLKHYVENLLFMAVLFNLSKDKEGGK
jgi:hypothetical protein